jgi:hypothetical protein
MDLQIILTSNNKSHKLKIGNLQIQKMLFIYNALENGWNVEKEEDTFFFKKPHEDNKKYFTDEYLKEFIQNQLSILK